MYGLSVEGAGGGRRRGEGGGEGWVKMQSFQLASTWIWGSVKGKYAWYFSRAERALFSMERS